MRLWHKDLIPVLPQKQLVSQWRECCCIAKNIATKGTPNHLLVNKILDYNFVHFVCYVDLVLKEMQNRNYKIQRSAYLKCIANLTGAEVQRRFSQDLTVVAGTDDIYKNWHNDQYFLQCYHNLEEKHDCGGISEAEWKRIEQKRRERL